MNFVLQPWQLVFLILAGWVNCEQQEVMDYLLTENAVLKEKLGKKRILLSDDQRRRLAAKGMVLGRKRLQEIGTLFTPDTILRWHRQLVAQKWNYSDRQEKRQGRPRVRQVIVDLAVKFAKENPSWGCDRIQGALANVGYQISIRRSRTSSKHTASNRPRNENARAPGRHSSRLTGTCWRRSISPQEGKKGDAPQ